MNLLFGLTLLFLSVFGSTIQAEPIIRVVAWNLKWFPGGGQNSSEEQKRIQMAGAQDVIKSLDPDILLLEEVANEAAVKELVSVLNGYSVQVVSKFAGRPQNLAIATRFRTLGAWYDGWGKNGNDDPPRGYAFAAIELPTKRLLLTYAVHYKSNLGTFDENVAKRIEASRQFLEHAEGMIKDYGASYRVAVLIGGDFNTSLDDQKFAAEPSLRMLQDTGFFWTFDAVPFAERFTIPASGGYPDNCFDHIFTLGLGKAQAKVIQVPGVSDHNPVILDFDASAETPLTLRPVQQTEQQVLTTVPQ